MLRGSHVAGLQDAVLDDAVGRRVEFGVGSCLRAMASAARLASSVGPGRSDVLLARASTASCRVSCAAFSLAWAPSAAARASLACCSGNELPRHQGLDPRIGALGIVAATRAASTSARALRISSGRLPPPGAPALLLGGRLRGALLHILRQALRIQRGQQLALMDPFALPHPHVVDAFRRVNASSTWRISALP